jgi:oxalate decarboxylase/phosphoglucose isomerase-like protein (cupin superfamily)
MIGKLFTKTLNTDKNHLITNFYPLVLGPKTQFAKHMKFSTSNYDKELLDPPKYPIETFEIYFNIKKNHDTLIFETSNTKCNLFVIYPKMIGREFNKTTSFTTYYKGEKKDTIFEIISGQGYFILETLEPTKDIKIIQIAKNSIIIIPRQYSFTIINTSPTENLLCINMIGKRTKTIGNILTKSCGNALYLLKSGFIKNKNASPAYNLEEISGDFLIDYNFSKEKGLYKEFIELPEKFNFLK